MGSQKFVLVIFMIKKENSFPLLMIVPFDCLTLDTDGEAKTQPLR